MLNLPRWGAKFTVLSGLLLLSAIGACQPPKMSAGDMNFESTLKRPGEPPIAVIDGTYIYASDVAWQAEAQNLIAPGEKLPRMDPRFDTALRELVDQRLLALSARAEGLDTQGWVQRRVALARERILSSVALEDHLAKTVTNRTVRAAFDRQVQLGRNTGTFEESREQIETLMIAEEVQTYMALLRQQSAIKVLIPETEKLLKIKQ